MRENGYLGCARDWTKRVGFLGLLYIVLFSYSLPLMSADMAGTEHDFSDEAWAASELCVVCHASHNTAETALWNHEISQANYQIFESSYGAQSYQPGANNVTRFCLSCHDGTVAIDSFGSQQGVKFISSGESGYIGTNLNGHHPASVEYDSNKVWHLRDLSSPSGLGGTIEDDLLRNGIVECISCHNVHNNNEGNVIMDSNALCEVCHDI